MDRVKKYLARRVEEHSPDGRVIIHRLKMVTLHRNADGRLQDWSMVDFDHEEEGTEYVPVLKLEKKT